MKPLRLRFAWLVLAMGCSGWAVSCTEEPLGQDPPTDNPNDPNDPNVPQPEPPEGATEFVSADGRAGQESRNNDDEGDFAGEEPSAGDGGGEERTVEEGDIYRVLSGSLILNLNSYRGLQIIDFSDVENPQIIGRLQVAGYPVEMYVVGDRAFLLLNNWYGYYGSREDVSVGRVDGGLVMSVDLSDPTAPEAIDLAHVPGWISKSRLTRGGDQAALYVATGGYDQWENEDGTWSWETRTIVQSFDVSDGTLEAKTQLNLGGYVIDIQATTEALLVARTDWDWNDGRSEVALVDIRDPAGSMVLADDITVDGQIRNQFNMDLTGGVLRVFSGSIWGNDRRNYLQTFDASDFSNLTPIDRATFGESEDLYATLFVGHKAFAVTYLRVDPFHAFEVTAEGEIREWAEFVVSGWNDFFRAVYGGERLVGIGVDDQGGSRTLAVSLYDISDLTNPEPLLDRAEVEADYSWSEANWDHRAFSVIEGAVSVEGPGGEEETGLVLLPFSGYSDEWSTYTAAVQIFTFSDTSLTRRGLMYHGTPVRRSFQPEEALTANLSEEKLSFFDTSDPSEPTELGSVELAPNYTDVMRFGDYTVRVKNGREYYYWWWPSGSELPDAVVEVVPADQNPDLSAAVASFAIPYDAQVYQSGDLLVAVTQQYIDGSTWPYSYHTTLRVFDLSDPVHPRTAGVLETDRLTVSSYGYYWGEDCWDCGGWWGGRSTDIQGIEDALVFLQRHQEQELLGRTHVCNTYAVENDYCWEGSEWRDDCSYYSGSITCQSLNGAEEYCYGAIQECSYDDEGGWSCEDVDAESIATTEYCYDYDQYRYWQRFTLETLDLTDPDAPALADTVDLGSENEGVSLLTEDSSAWVTFRRPAEVEDDSRPYVRYYIQEVDLSDPGSPAVAAPINVPGELVAIDGDVIFTRDLLWGEEIVETAIARLEIFEGLAYLQATRRFADEYVEAVALDRAGHVLVSHQMAWNIAYSNGVTDNPAYMAVLDDADLGLLSDIEVDSWATLKDGRAGRALFQVPGGLLVFNLDDPTAPYAQAFFSTLGWPSEILVDGRDILFAGGRYGIYSFDLDTYNLIDL